MQPNVLVVMMDTARADAFEPYGATPGTTPAVADLARRGNAVAGVHAPAAWTVPSHASMFTGLMPRELGVCQAPGGPDGCRTNLERHHDRFLPEVLRRAGYSTLAMSSNPWVSPQSGFDHGFDEFTMLRSRPVSFHHGDRGASALRWYIEALRARFDDGAREAESRLGTWIKGRGEKPFFWFVNLLECHSPYLPPRPYAFRSPLERLRLAHDALHHQSLEAVWRACLGNFDLSEQTVRRFREMYRQSIRLMDAWLARVLEAFDSARLLEDTLVVVISDHGENIGEGRLVGHSFSLDDRLLRVPLVQAGPVMLSAGSVSTLADFPWMVASALGLEDHPWPAPVTTDGVVVAQADGVAPLDDARIQEAIKRWDLGPDGARRLTTAMTCATDGGLKLFRDGDRAYMYDLGTDPLELQPLAVDGAARTKYGERLDRLTRALERDLAGAAPALAAPARPEALSENAELERQMRMLGYL